MTFLAATALEAVISPVIGRISDRRGRIAPLRFGLAAATGALLLFVVPNAPVPMAIVVVAIAASTAGFWAPAMAMLSDAADARGLDQGLAAALTNLAWAGGQIIGSGGGGGVAKVAGDALPMIGTSALCAATLLALTLRGSVVLSAAARSRSR